MALNPEKIEVGVLVYGITPSPVGSIPCKKIIENNLIRKQITEVTDFLLVEFSVRLAVLHGTISLFEEISMKVNLIVFAILGVVLINWSCLKAIDYLIYQNDKSNNT
jgi:hypothetical protein